MTVLRYTIMCVASVLALVQIAVSNPQSVRKMALTFDDLPYAASVGQPWQPNAERVTKQTLAVLKQYRAPAIGFVNEINVEGLEARIALLREWLDAGMTLGNHTYSHRDFNRETIERFQEEITRGEVITRRVMADYNRELRYFRHPATHTGDTREKKETIESFLTARGYRVTPHTIENSDFMFTVPYSRALQRKDDAELKRLRATYLDYTLAATEFAEKISPQIFGREIPQTLLLHVNDINADCLDELLQRLAARGYEFISLDEAMADPAYRTRDTLVSEYGPTWLWRWMRSLGMNVSFEADPEPPGWIVDQFNQRHVS